MPDRIDEVDRLQFLILQQRALTARAALDVAERDVEIARLRIVAHYHVGDADEIKLDTGEIKRAAPVAAPSAPPESSDATASAHVDIISPAPLRAV